jgi:hypothetical protein
MPRVVVNGIALRVLPNGTVDLGYDERHSDLHQAAKDFDSSVAWRLGSVGAVFAQSAQAIDGSVVLDVDDESGRPRGLPAVDLADLLRMIWDYTPPHLYLHMGLAGGERNGFAQQLAMELDTFVRATPAPLFTPDTSEVAGDPTVKKVPTWYDFAPEANCVVTVRDVDFAELFGSGALPA